MKKLSLLTATAVIVASVSGAAYAETQMAQTRTQQSLATSAMTETELGQLVGKNVENAAGEKIGEIDSVYIGRDGKVKSVVVGVGGFLGVGEHDVALNWDSLNVATNGDVSVSFTKDQLKAMPEYEYLNPTQRGTVFRDPS